MSVAKRVFIVLCIFATELGLVSGVAYGQQAEAIVKNAAEQKFAPFPGVPTCATGAVESGNPASGPSVILIKSAAGCTVPWHWHTPNEHLMMLSGVARVQMKDGKPVLLRPGGYVLSPPKHAHRLHCTGPCTFFVSLDGALDFHYVDSSGKELSPDDALKAVKETPGKGGM